MQVSLEVFCKHTNNSRHGSILKYSAKIKLSTFPVDWWYTRARTLLTRRRRGRRRQTWFHVEVRRVWTQKVLFDFYIYQYLLATYEAARGWNPWEKRGTRLFYSYMNNNLAATHKIISLVPKIIQNIYATSLLCNYIIQTTLFDIYSLTKYILGNNILILAWQHLDATHTYK